jgi:hypothetical protein
MFTPNVLMKWGFRDVQSGDVNKGVVLFANVVNAVLLQIKTHSCSGLIFEDALKVYSIPFLVFSGKRELEMGSIFKKQ